MVRYISATSAPSVGAFKSFLELGMRSSEVKALQDKLKALGHFDPKIDSTGYFGPVTFDAVKKFQKANGLAQVGFVGPGTRAALNKIVN